MAFEYLDTLGKAREALKLTPDTKLGKLAKDFAETAVALMKSGVQKGSGAMAASIAFRFRQEDDEMVIEFLADSYWDYLNSGVDGVLQSAGAVENVFGQSYSFKSLNPSRSMVDSFLGTDMRGWLAQKGITSLTYGGETHQLTTDSDYRGAAFVLARATKAHGIKPSEFVNNTFSDENLEKIEQALLNEYAKLF